MILSIMTTAPPLSALVIMRSFLFVSSSIAACSLYDKFEFFSGLCYLYIDIIFYIDYICTYCTLCFFGGQFSLIFDLKGYFFIDWFIAVIQVSHLKWAEGNLISWKKFCKSKDNWILYLFEVGTLQVPQSEFFYFLTLS